MNTNNALYGLLELDKTYSPFSYEKGVLRIYPPTKDVWKKRRWSLFDHIINQTKNDEWIPMININGILYNGQKIVFCVFDSQSLDNGMILYRVDTYYIFEPNIGSEKLLNKIQVRGDEINVFYDSSKIFERDFSNKAIIKAHEAQKEYLGKYDYNGTEICIYAGVHWILNPRSANKAPIESKSCLWAESSGFLSVEDAYEIISNIHDLLQYFCYRKNIKFREIKLYDGETLVGKMFVVRNDMILPESTLNWERNVISWDNLNSEENKIDLSPLFIAIYKDEIGFSHFCESREKQYRYSISRALQIFAAFEGEFNCLLKSDFSRSPGFILKKRQAIDALKEIRDKSSRKDKNYMDFLINSLNNLDYSFSQRIQKAIVYCFDALKGFMEEKYGSSNKSTYQMIAERMGKLRNNFAHGNMDSKIDAINIVDLQVLERLYYAMRLKKMDVPDNVIANCCDKVIGRD